MKHVTIITGGAGGMGFATAKIIGKEHFLVLSDIREENLQKAVKDLSELGIESSYFVSDVTKYDSVVDLLKFAKTKGSVVGMVHTAGVSPQMGDYNLMVNVNAIGTINVTKAFYDYADHGASLVNVASMAGHLLPNFIIPTKAYKFSLTDMAEFEKRIKRRIKLFPKKQRSGLAYSIAKRFVIWYSNKMAKQFGEKGMRILSVSPGTFMTDMGKLEEASGAVAMAEKSALARVGAIEEIAVVLACASNEGSYLTGIDILCDGGVVATIPLRELSKIEK